MKVLPMRALACEHPQQVVLAHVESFGLTSKATPQMYFGMVSGDVIYLDFPTMEEAEAMVKLVTTQLNNYPVYPGT